MFTYNTNDFSINSSTVSLDMSMVNVIVVYILNNFDNNWLEGGHRATMVLISMVTYM